MRKRKGGWSSAPKPVRGGTIWNHPIIMSITIATIIATTIIAIIIVILSITIIIIIVIISSHSIFKMGDTSLKRHQFQPSDRCMECWSCIWGPLARPQQLCSRNL